MYFGLSEDQIFFQDNVKKFLEDNAPLDAVKKITEGADLSTKNELHLGLINLGINNILIPEENGGLGLDLLFASAVSQSLGEGIATLPFVGPYVIAPIAIKYGASDSQKEKLFNEMSQNLINCGVGFSEYFGSRIRIGRPMRVQGLPQALQGSQFSAIIGLAIEISNLQDEVWDFEIPTILEPGQRLKSAVNWLKENW